MISILGSTGSIGVSTLDVVSRNSDRFRVAGLAGGDNVELLARQAEMFRPLLVSTRTEEGAETLRGLLDPRLKIRVMGTEAGATAVASMPEAETVVSAFVGAAGLRPTLAAVEAGKTVALANKESLVVAGALLSQAARKSGARILPVDSEHSAIFQCLAGSDPRGVRKIWLTASGGPFFSDPSRDLSTVTPRDALNHPNWKMGSKITIDSATMMNKGLEIIEARWLFDIPAERIGVVIHPQSVVHSMVEFIDGSVLAQLGVPDMRGPIAYALAYPQRLDAVVPPPDLTALKSLTFSEPDAERFPATDMARRALASGESHPAALNGANEVTVAAFLAGSIGFLDIARINAQVLAAFRPGHCERLEDFLAADWWGREKAAEIIGSAACCSQAGTSFSAGAR